MRRKKNLFLLMGMCIGLLITPFAYAGTAITINYSIVDLNAKTITLYGINLNAFGIPAVTIGDTVLDGCNVEAGKIECSIEGTPAISGGTWRVRVSAGNSPNANDQIDVFISVGLVPTLCTPGDLVLCYSGPPSTRDVGECASGIRTCLSDGTWSACQGEILPVTEICPDELDNDCNGEVDNGCVDPCEGNPCGAQAYCTNTGGGNHSCACWVGYGNCDDNWANGCETNLSNDPSNCGACGEQCPSGSLCVSSQCTPQVTCGPSTCSWGCCMGNICMEGDTWAACGFNGQACVVCGPTEVCHEPGVCQ